MPPPSTSEKRRPGRQTRRGSVMGRIQSAVDMSVRQRYPLLFTDLTDNEVTKLITTLDIVNTPNWRSPLPKETRLSLSIEELPAALKKNKMYHRVVSKDRRPPTTVCSVHAPLNPFVMHHLFDLIDFETTEHIWRLNRYIDSLEPSVRDTVQELNAMRRMWVLPEDEVIPKPDNKDFQRNRCEVCIITKIIGEETHLQNLRSCLLARQYVNSKTPRLMKFVDKSMFTHGTKSATLFFMSDKLSLEVLEARKETDSLRRLSKGRREIELLRAKAAEREAGLIELQREHMQAKVQEIIVYMDPESSEDARSNQYPQPCKRCDNLPDEIIATYATTTETGSSPSSSPRSSADNVSSPSPSSSSSSRSSHSKNGPPSSSRSSRSKKGPPMPDVAPLSISRERPTSMPSTASKNERPSYHRVSSLRYSAQDQEEKIYLPPRDGIDWGNVVHRTGPLDDLIDQVDGMTVRPKRVDELRGQSQVAIQYQNLPSPQIAPASLANALNAPPQDGRLRMSTRSEASGYTASAYTDVQAQGNPKPARSKVSGYRASEDVGVQAKGNPTLDNRSQTSEYRASGYTDVQAKGNPTPDNRPEVSEYKASGYRASGHTDVQAKGNPKTGNPFEASEYSAAGFSDVQSKGNPKPDNPFEASEYSAAGFSDVQSKGNPKPDNPFEASKDSAAGFSDVQAKGNLKPDNPFEASEYRASEYTDVRTIGNQKPYNPGDTTWSLVMRSTEEDPGV